MAEVRNVDGKMTVQTEENFQKTILNEIKNLKSVMGQKWLILVFACYLIAYIIRIMESKFKQIYYSDDGYWKGKSAIQELSKASGSTKEEAENAY